MTFIEERPVKVRNSYEPRPVYARDREQMKRVWMKTRFHLVSEKILEEDNIILDTRLPFRRGGRK